MTLIRSRKSEGNWQGSIRSRSFSSCRRRSFLFQRGRCRRLHPAQLQESLSQLFAARQSPASLVREGPTSPVPPRRQGQSWDKAEGGHVPPSELLQRGQDDRRPSPGSN